MNFLNNCESASCRLNVASGVAKRQMSVNNRADTVQSAQTFGFVDFYIFPYTGQPP